MIIPIVFATDLMRSDRMPLQLTVVMATDLGSKVLICIKIYWTILMCTKF